MEKATILWVHDYFEVPLNGLAEYKGEQVWFRCDTQHQIVSSTDVEVPIPSKLENSAHEYSLLRLSKEDMDLVTKDHLEYCTFSGAPLNYGDPVKIKRKTITVKADPKTLVEPETKHIDASLRSLGDGKHYQHLIIAGTLKGEFLAAIKESDFTNFRVPRRVEHIVE
jgi:hypothetical protein